jgi:class 3 adenylate cyclase
VRECGDTWSWESLGARPIKGREHPVHAYRLEVS